jgi:hypothetical protein
MNDEKTVGRKSHSDVILPLLVALLFNFTATNNYFEAFLFSTFVFSTSSHVNKFVSSYHL